MTSGFPGEFFHGGGTRPTIGGTQGGGFPFGFQQQGGNFMADQIGIQQRRADLFMGKRSFSDFQSQQQIQILLQQQQQSQKPLSLLQQQYLMRSVKQRTNNFPVSQISPLDLSSPTNSTFSTRVGLPVYRSQPQNNNNFSLQTFNNNITLFNPAFSYSGQNVVQVPKQEFGYLNPVQPKPDPGEDRRIMSTLHELEKELLNDDDDGNQPESDAVSVVTNSEWSDTFQNLIGPDPSLSPNGNSTSNPVSASTSGSNTTNNMISPSPTSSSTSSCCSTSASPVAAMSPPISAKQLISEAAAAISDGKIEASKELLGRLAQSANAKGSAEQRLAFYMCDALRSRVDPRAHAPPVTELFGKEHMSAMYSLYDLSPCFKFGVFAANLVMLEAIASGLHEGLKIHVVDFDIGHGAQYMNLLRAMAERSSQSASTTVKITVVETEMGVGATMETVKEGLVNLAQKIGINLKFERLTRKIHELTRESLGCEDGEAIVVNFAFKLYRVPDESVSMENFRDELLRRVKGLNPRAVTLVEQDLNANTAPFMTRVNGACEYYGALFDSFDSVVPRDNKDRTRVEEALGRKMVNSVACEGRERVERAEVFGKWRARMGMAGFEMKPLGQSVAESMRGKLNSARGGNPGFTVKEESGGVGFGWMGRTLNVASAWR